MTALVVDMPEQVLLFLSFLVFLNRIEERSVNYMHVERLKGKPYTSISAKKKKKQLRLIENTSKILQLKMEEIICSVSIPLCHLDVLIQYFQSKSNRQFENIAKSCLS